MKSIVNFIRGTVLFLLVVTAFSSCKKEIIPVTSADENNNNGISDVTIYEENVAQYIIHDVLTRILY